MVNCIAMKDYEVISVISEYLFQNQYRTVVYFRGWVTGSLYILDGYRTSVYSGGCEISDLAWYLEDCESILF